MAEYIITTAVATTGGAIAVTDLNEDVTLTIGGTWAQGEMITLFLVDESTGVNTQVGAGTVTGILPIYCFTYDNKVYALADSKVYFSALLFPTVWNNPDASGRGAVSVASKKGNALSLVAMETYQGRMAFFSEDVIQLWTLNADPSLWQLTQVLEKIGTSAPLSVQSIGDLDLMFLHTTGIRSLRARETTLNAFVNDLGSPIDLLIQDALSGLNGDMSGVCSIVDPNTNRYWIYLNGLIYTFSYFPSGKVAAWSVYEPSFTDGDVIPSPNDSYPDVSGDPQITFNNLTIGQQYIIFLGENEVSFSTASGSQVDLTDNLIIYTSGATTGFMLGNLVGNSYTGIIIPVTHFIPTQFVVNKQRILARDANALYSYGDGAYDNTLAMVETPWMDDKQPSTIKGATNIDVACTSDWLIQASMNYPTGEAQAVIDTSGDTFDKGVVSYSDRGTHFMFRGISTSNQRSVLSSLTLHYQSNGEVS